MPDRKIFVQIKIQRHALWHVKGCTAYVADGMVPIRPPDGGFLTRRCAIRAMKEMVREQLMLTCLYRERDIGWQLLLWHPAQPIDASESIVKPSCSATEFLIDYSLAF